MVLFACFGAHQQCLNRNRNADFIVIPAEKRGRKNSYLKNCRFSSSSKKSIEFLIFILRLMQKDNNKNVKNIRKKYRWNAWGIHVCHRIWFHYRYNTFWSYKITENWETGEKIFQHILIQKNESRLCTSVYLYGTMLCISCYSHLFLIIITIFTYYVMYVYFIHSAFSFLPQNVHSHTPYAHIHINKHRHIQCVDRSRICTTSLNVIVIVKMKTHLGQTQKWDENNNNKNHV